MLLRDAIAALDELPETATLFVRRLSGEFRPESPAVLLEISDEELRRPVVEIAATRAPGTEYFLEVDEAKHFVAGLRQNCPSEYSTLDQIVARLIYYAANDA